MLIRHTPQQRAIESIMTKLEMYDDLANTEKSALVEYIEELESENGQLKNSIVQQLRKITSIESLFDLHSAREWTEEDGCVLWWHLPVCEPPYVGLHECMGELQADETPTACACLQRGGWLTHWSRIPNVYDPVCHCGIEYSKHTPHDGHSFTEMEPPPEMRGGVAFGLVCPGCGIPGHDPADHELYPQDLSIPEEL